MRIRYLSLAIAACIAVTLIMVPIFNREVSPLDELNIGYEPSEDFRAASPEVSAIMELIGNKEFDDALVKVHAVMAKSEKDVKDTEYLWDCFADEESEYEYHMAMFHDSELRWLYIWLLVRTENYTEAESQLKVYLKNKEYCMNEKQAEVLLKKIKEM